MSTSYLILTNEQKEKLKVHTRRIWQTYEKVRVEKARTALGKVQILKGNKAEAVDSYMSEQDLDMKNEIKEKVDAIKAEIAEAEKAAAEAQDFERDFDEFIGFAFDFLENLKTNWWSLDKVCGCVNKSYFRLEYSFCQIKKFIYLKLA